MFLNFDAPTPKPANPPDRSVAQDPPTGQMS